MRAWWLAVVCVLPACDGSDNKDVLDAMGVSETSSDDSSVDSRTDSTSDATAGDGTVDDAMMDAGADVEASCDPKNALQMHCDYVNVSVCQEYYGWDGFCLEGGVYEEGGCTTKDQIGVCYIAVDDGGREIIQRCYPPVTTQQCASACASVMGSVFCPK